MDLSYCILFNLTNFQYDIYLILHRNGITGTEMPVGRNLCVFHGLNTYISTDKNSHYDSFFYKLKRSLVKI